MRNPVALLAVFSLAIAFGAAPAADAQECAVIVECTGQQFLQHFTREQAWGGDVLFDHSDCQFCWSGGEDPEIEAAETCHPQESSCLPMLPEPIAAVYVEVARAAFAGDAYAVLKHGVTVPEYVRFDAATKSVQVTGCSGAVIASVSVRSDATLWAMAQRFAAYRELVVGPG